MSDMTKKLIIGNWKMNVDTADKAADLAAQCRSLSGKLAHTEIVVCPPFPFIPAAAASKMGAGYHLGAQSASAFEGGSHTGEVGAKMLADLGVEYVIAGHSEERSAGDTDELIAGRIARVIEAGMTAVVCVGEKARDEAGTHLEFIKNQMGATLAGISADRSKRIILAYEPVWAIGANEAMAADQVYEMSLFVKKVFADLFGADVGRKLRVLYGGSVNAANARDIMAVGKVDGLLVGRESVSAAGFAELLKAVDAI